MKKESAIERAAGALVHEYDLVDAGKSDGRKIPALTRRYLKLWDKANRE